MDERGANFCELCVMHAINPQRMTFYFYFCCFTIQLRPTYRVNQKEILLEAEYNNIERTAVLNKTVIIIIVGFN